MILVSTLKYLKVKHPFDSVAAFVSARAILLFSLLLVGCGRTAEDYLKRGNDLFSVGNHSEAVLNYRKSIQRNSAFGEAHYRLGLALVKLAKPDEAQEAFAGAVREAPNLIDAKIQLAKLDLEAYINDPRRPPRLYDRLKKTAVDLLSKDAESVDGLRVQGELALLNRAPGEAVTAFSKAHEIRPTQPEVAHGLMRSLMGTNQTAEAEKLALDFIDKDKSYGLMYDDLYALYQIERRPGDAEAVFRMKVVNNPTVSAYRLQLAAHFFNNKKPAEMEAALQPLANEPKQFADGRLDVAQFYARVSMWEKAQTLYEEVVKTDQNNRLKARKLVIQALVAQNKNDEAHRAADDVVRDFPDDTEARFVRASLWVDSKDKLKIKAAIDELEHLREKQGKVPIFWYVLGQAYRRTGDDKKAEASYREAVKVNRGFKPGFVALTELSLEKGQAKAAMEFIGQAATVDEEDPQIRLLRVRALLESGRRGEARAELISLAGAYPRVADIQVQYGIALLAERRYDPAETIFKRFYRPGQSDLRPLEGLVRVYGMRGQGKRAFDLAEAELKQNPQSIGVRRLLAQVAVAEKRLDVAVQQYTELIRAEPRVGLYHYELAQVLRSKGDIQAAIASLEKAEQLEPDNPVPQSVLAFLLQEAGRNDEAVKRLRRLVQLRPDDSNVQNNLAFLLAETGQSLDEALALARKALQKSPGDPNYMDTLGWIYLKQRRADIAVQTFRATAQKNPDNPVYLHHLGLALIENGQKSEARVVLDAALQKKPEKAEKIKILDVIRRIG